MLRQAAGLDMSKAGRVVRKDGVLNLVRRCLTANLNTISRS